MNITKLSINRPILVIVLFLVLGILGLFSWSQLRYELLPNIATPYVTIVTVYPGASPTEVENGITRPLEEAVAGGDRIKRITSQSIENVSVVSIEYRADANADLTLQEAQRRVNEMVATLPAGAKTPSLSKYSLADLPVLRVAAASPLPPLDFGQLLDTQVKARLSQVPGVGQVVFIGLPETEVRINLNASRLRAFRLSALQVAGALQQSNLNVPSGQINDRDGDFSVRVVGKTDVLRQLADVVVLTAPNGQTVRLGEVATLAIGQKTPENLNHFDRKAAVGILIRKQSGANNVAVSRAVRDELTRLQTELAARRVTFTVAQDGSEFTLAAAEAVQHDLGLAIGLVALVMFVFLHSLRSSLIVLVAIPASLLSTFVFMGLLGFSLNLLTLLALSLVIGILVDDSIVVLESIYQQLEKAGVASGKDKQTAALDGRNSIGFSAVAITLVDVVVFVPLSLAPGLIGDLMREFSLVVVISTLFSLLVSFTLTPMIASRFGQLEDLSGNSLMARFGRGFERLFDGLANQYRELLAWCLSHRAVTVLIVLGLFVGSLLLPMFGFVGGEFTAPTDKGEANLILQLPEGTNLRQTDTLARRFEQALYRMPEVRRVFTNVGVNADGLAGTTGNSAEFTVTFSPREERVKSLTDLIREAKTIAATFAGVRVRAYPLGLLGSDNATPIVLLVNGPDRPEVQQQAVRMAGAMRGVAGMADVRVSGSSRKPEVLVETDREKLARYGLTTEGVGAAVRTALAGFDELKIQQTGGVGKGRAVTLRLRYAEADRNRTDALGQMTLLNASGQPVELRQVARIREVFSPAVLERQNRANAVTISAQVVGRPVGDVGEDMKQAIAKLNLPTSVRIVYGGDLELQDDSFGKLGLVFGAAILFMYLIMVALYNSWRTPFVVLFSIPVALVGALLALALTMNSLNVFSILGLIMMLGLVAKNAILLVDQANRNRKSGQSVRDALLNAGRTRLRPILMTTLAMVVGMLPIALAHGPGAELKQGLAWALIGGLSSSMFLTLIFVPVVYAVGGEKGGAGGRERKREEGKERERGEIDLKPVVSLLFLGAILLATNVFAQSSSSGFPAKNLALSDLPTLIRQNNGQVRAAQYDGLRAEARAEEVRRGWWPTLNGQGTYQYNIKKPVFFFPAFTIDPNIGTFAFDNGRLTAVEAALTHAYTGAVNLAMPLIQPDLKITERQAQTARQLANETTRATIQQQITEAKKLYLNALWVQEQRALLLRSLARAQTLLSESRNRYRVQLATDADTLRAFVEAENLRPSRAKLDRTARQLTNQLAVVLGLETGTALTLTDSLTCAEPAATSLDALPDETGYVAQALNQRPELRQLRLNLDQARQQAQAERTRRLPTLSLYGQAGTLAQVNSFDFRGSQWPFVAYVGLQLNLPIWNPANSVKIQQARLANDQTQEQLRYNKRLIANDVQAALDTQAEARDRLRQQAGLIRAAERSYALTRDRYRQGIARFADLTDADLALRQAQSNRIQAVYDLRMAEVELERAVGPAD